MDSPAPASLCRVLIVDDHGMIRESIAQALQRCGDLDVVGTAGCAAEARRLADTAGPDVAVVDYGLPDGTGVELAAELGRRVPPVSSLILTASEGAEAAAEAVAAGCAGFLRKSADLCALVRGVRRIHQGESLFDAPTLSAAIDWMRRPALAKVELSGRELEVLQHLADGATTPEISEALVLSHHTVRNHVRNVLQKLGARSQLEGVVIASTMSLVEVGRGRRAPGPQDL